jgi:large subunit ribosomal protein L17
MAKKLGKPTDQRLALLYNQASYLLWYGKIETTVQRAKEVKKIAEKMLTLAINNYTDIVTVTKKKLNVAKELVDVEFKNDGPGKLNARRRIMKVLVPVQEPIAEKEKLSEYKARVKDMNHPLIEKIFNEHAPRYAQRNSTQSQGGGYTRIIRLGNRRGDDAEMAILELV